MNNKYSFPYASLDNPFAAEWYVAVHYNPFVHKGNVGKDGFSGHDDVTVYEVIEPEHVFNANVTHDNILCALRKIGVDTRYVTVEYYDLRDSDTHKNAPINPNMHYKLLEKYGDSYNAMFNAVDVGLGYIK